jgi:hypothetical protein
MEPLAFIIAILGCGEGDAPCRQVRTLEARYESRVACTAATDAAVTQNSDIDYPVVVARCVAGGATPSQLQPGQVELPGPERPGLRTAALTRRR